MVGTWLGEVFFDPLKFQFNETESLAVGVKNVIVHPRWFNKAGESPGDVALLKLDRQ